MSKTTALTFIAAFLLLSVCVMAGIYGPGIIESRLHATDGLWPYAIYSDHDPSFKTLDQMVLLTGLLAVSLSIAGAMLWDRETQPQARQASILGLDETALATMVRPTATRRTIVAANVHVDGISAPAQEEESLTPLERVIRGY